VAQKTIHIFTDGSCLGNPGPGGYGAVLVYNNHRKELSGGFAHTTNNRMELMAPIEALNSLTEPCNVELTTDSQVKNADLWKRLDEAVSKHKINWHWVKGHSGHPENERCDDLARGAAEAKPTTPDSGFTG